MYDVVGISNSLVDVCVEVDDDFIKKHELKKGLFNLIDQKTFKNIHDKLGKKKIEFGGSVSNTLAGLNLLGCDVAEFAAVGKDEYGNLISDNNIKKKIGNYLSKHNLPTGTVLNLITPDTERTFATFLGASQKVQEDDIKEDIIANAKILYLTGYEFESLKKAVYKAADIAKKNKVMIAFDIADPGVIERNLIELKKFVDKYVDILFANEKEAMEFTGLEPEKAVEKLGEKLSYSIVKIGSKGSYIKVAHLGNTWKISAEKIDAKDTTGAGDMYAAGILYGILKELPVEKIGKIASYAAAKVVEVTGARIESLDVSNLK